MDTKTRKYAHPSVERRALTQDEALIEEGLFLLCRTNLSRAASLCAPHHVARAGGHSGEIRVFAERALNVADLISRRGS